MRKRKAELETLYRYINMLAANGSNSYDTKLVAGLVRAQLEKCRRVTQALTRMRARTHSASA